MTSKEAKEFYSAIDLMAKEKKIDKDELLEKVKTALTLAVRKQYGSSDNVVVDLDPTKNRFKVYINKTVVEEVIEQAYEITLEEALKLSKRAKLGGTVKVDVNSKKIGRLAASAAKQQIRRSMRDVEREQITMQLKEKIGQILICKVVKVDPLTDNAIVKFGDSSSTILFKSEQLPNDNLRVGDVIRVYVTDLVTSPQNSNLKISRTNPLFVKELFGREIPEIENNQIEIKKVAREAGYRTKVAVSSNDENIDPVGTCIGQRSLRLTSISNELMGEKIDIIPYDDDIEKFIASSLAPAKVVEVEIAQDPELNEDVAFVSVPDSQLSLAIGSKGMNAKLAAHLTGYKIDISPESGFYGEDKKSSLKDKLENRLKQKSNND